MFPPLKGGFSLPFGGCQAFPPVGRVTFSLLRRKFPSWTCRTVYGSSLVLRVLEELNGKSDKVVLVVMLEMLLLISLANALRSDLQVTPLSLYSNFLLASEGPQDFRGFTPSRNSWKQKKNEKVKNTLGFRNSYIHFDSHYQHSSYSEVRVESHKFEYIKFTFHPPSEQYLSRNHTGMTRIGNATISHPRDFAQSEYV